MNSVARDRLDERVSIIVEVGVVVEQIHELPSLLEVFEEFGILLRESKDVLAEFSFVFLESLDRLVLYHLTTPDALLFVTRRLLATARALERTDRLLFLSSTSRPCISAYWASESPPKRAT